MDSHFSSQTTKKTTSKTLNTAYKFCIISCLQFSSCRHLQRGKLLCQKYIHTHTHTQKNWKSLLQRPCGFRRRYRRKPGQAARCMDGEGIHTKLIVPQHFWGMGLATAIFFTSRSSGLLSSAVWRHEHKNTKIMATGLQQNCKVYF